MSTHATALPCQRHLFDLPADIAYLDAAAWAVIPHAVRAAGEEGILRKSRPWAYRREDSAAWVERARTAAATLIGASADGIAIAGSVSHAMATAARNLAPPTGHRILYVAHEFPSHRLPWDRLAAERGLTVEVVARPTDGDWTTALAAAIDRPGAPPLAIAALTPLHWSDGAAIDIAALRPAIRATGAALVIDATQAVGAMPVDVARLDPDFLAFPTYKWVLGPYGLAFLYAAPSRRDGVPIEENSGNQRPTAGARRYDKGELNEPVGLSMAALGMELVASWGPASIAARVEQLTDRLAEGLTAAGVTVLPKALRVPHILGAHREGGWPQNFIEALRQRGVYASDRLGVLRLSPHVWADEADIDRCLAAITAILGGER